MKVWKGVLLAGLGLGGGLLAYAWAGERPRMRLQRYRLSLPESRGAGLRILHLSDQHLGGDTWVQRQRLQRLRTLLSQLSPDIIVLTGDFLHNAAGLLALEELLQMLPSAPLGRYAVLGNHDYAEYSYRVFFGEAWENIKAARAPQQRFVTTWAEIQKLTRLAWQIWRNERLRFAAVPNPTAELRALLELYDVQVLHNRSVPLPEIPLWLVGVDDRVEGKPDLAMALAGVPADAEVWLLAHNPDQAYEVKDPRVKLVFAGHTHGGQVILPGIGAVHTQGTQLGRRRPAGVFTDLPTGGYLVVSRGMGESTPLRFRCSPEVVLIELKARQPAGVLRK